MQFILVCTNIVFQFAVWKVTTGGKQRFTFVSLVVKANYFFFLNIYFDH